MNRARACGKRIFRWASLTLRDLAPIIHTQINQGVDHRVHSAPTQEKGRRPQGFGMSYAQSDNKGSDLDRGYLLSVNSVSALCVLCGGKVWFVGV